MARFHQPEDWPRSYARRRRRSPSPSRCSTDLRDVFFLPPASSNSDGWPPRSMAEGGAAGPYITSCSAQGDPQLRVGGEQIAGEWSAFSSFRH